MFPSPQNGIGFLAVVTGLIGLATTILWIVIGWRAMRAHESLAENVELIQRQLRKNANHTTGDSEGAKGMRRVRLDE